MGELTKLKIKRNLHIVELLELENKIVKVEMVQKYRLLQYNIKYIAKLKKVIGLEAQQLAQFKIGREYDIKLLVDELNQDTLQIQDLDTDLTTLKNNCITVIQKINGMNDEVPLFAYITGYEKN